MGVAKQWVADRLELLAPRRYAEEWDNVGLQVGSLDGDVESIYVALTPDEPTIASALRSGAGMLVTHHPLIFKALQRIDTSVHGPGTGRCISECLRGGLTVYSCHTNFDIAPGGTSDALVKAIGFDDAQLVAGPLRPSVAGGDPDSPGVGGLGRRVVLREASTLVAVAERIRARLACGQVRLVGEGDTPIRSLGICGGAGAELIAACAGRIDALVTGDVRYHDALLALDCGMCLIDAGHYATEMPGVRALGAWLLGQISLASLTAGVLVDTEGRDPFAYL